jgi:RimJ/RimL family protein N-acetyltransferase
MRGVEQRAELWLSWQEMEIDFETPRLLLRRFCEDDAGLLLELDSDPEVMRHVGPYQLADVEAYRQHIRARWLPCYAAGRGLGFWAAVTKEGAEFLGWFTLRPALDYRFAAEAGFGPDDFELGYRLRRAAWGRGYATEGARALVRRGFTALGVTRVVAAALVTNGASLRVLEKVGLRQVGRFAVPGFEHPAATFALTKEQIDAIPAADRS